MRHWIIALLCFLLGIAADGIELGLGLAVIAGVASLAFGKSVGADNGAKPPASGAIPPPMTLWQMQQRLEALEIEVQLLREQLRSSPTAVPAAQSPNPAENAPAATAMPELIIPPRETETKPEPLAAIEWEVETPGSEPEPAPISRQADETPPAAPLPFPATPAEPTLLALRP
ncbi:hypothetical protein J9978_05270 [Chromobacterium violaceum]|uniref:hypothetical protein n=1 Tax=Chromobacterium violaceum TaxID=536 RepID=UPI001B32BD39|nr:hypothetical protein [Chromobacterium violaceum]MBP4048907.1 hypothetical protein [Chromobacterium violaceum]